jgi:hypothetical protein
MTSGQTLLLKGPGSRPLTGDENQPLKPKSQKSGAQLAPMVSSVEATAAVGSLTRAAPTPALVTAATCARHDHRLGGGRTAAPWPGNSSSPSPAWLEDASSAGLEDALLPRMLEEEAGHRPTQEVGPHSARSSSSAWMMNILEAEGGAEAAARLASPHHKAGDHPYG